MTLQLQEHCLDGYYGTNLHYAVVSKTSNVGSVCKNGFNSVCHEGSMADFRSFIRVISRNAVTARSGNAAERHMCNHPVIRQKLERYFGKPIAEIQLISGRKKSDVLVQFDDGSQVRIQNKNGPGKNRGWSADRRAVSKMPLDDIGKQLLVNVCLKKSGERPEVNRPVGLIYELLMGAEPEYVPEYFTHSIFHGENVYLSIAPADKVLIALNEIAYPQLLAKRTCVHISPLMYLQRKGGGRADNSPDDIQLKLVSLPESIMEVI